MVKKIWLGFLLFWMLVVSVNAFYRVENFASLPSSYYWTYYLGDDTVTPPYIEDGHLVFNTTLNNQTYYYFNFPFNYTQGITVNFEAKFTNPGSVSTIGHLMISDRQDLNFNLPGLCSFALISAESTPTDQIWFYWRDGADVFNQYSVFSLLYNWNSNWHNYSIIIGSNFSYWRDGSKILSKALSNHGCENKTNLTVTFGVYGNTIYDDAQFILNKLSISALSNELDVIPACDEPCEVNITFSYPDSICNNGWEAGICSDLNLPSDNQTYICNSSSQVIAYPFGTLTDAAGLVNWQFDLDIKSDYEVLAGLVSNTADPAIILWMDNGSIKNYYDKTEIATYNFNQTYEYKLIIDLTNHNFDFYLDDSLQENDVDFYSDVDNIYSFFFQPDYVEGFPYCDYELDNILLTKAIAEIPTSNDTWKYGDYLNLNPSNPSFNYAKACKPGENVNTCFLRANFESLLSGLTDFAFDNFLLFLMLLIIIIIIIIMRQANKK